jgi:hypothetical protein
MEGAMDVVSPGYHIAYSYEAEEKVPIRKEGTYGITSWPSWDGMINLLMEIITYITGCGMSRICLRRCIGR